MMTRRSVTIVIISRTQRFGEQFEPVIDQLVTEITGDLFLQSLDLFIEEFDNLASLHVDQMIVVIILNLFVTGPTIPEIMLFENIGFLEKTDRAVHRCNGNTRIKLRGPAIDLIHIRVIFSLLQHTRDGTPLAGQLQALINA